jgi:hypothetical protein
MEQAGGRLDILCVAKRERRMCFGGSAKRLGRRQQSKMGRESLAVFFSVPILVSSEHTYLREGPIGVKKLDTHFESVGYVNY